MELEGKINQFVSDLPADYRVDLNSPPLLEDEDSHASLILARSCELQIVANRMIISLYVPYLKAHSVTPLHQASFAIVDAAHKIIRCMEIWQSRRDCSGIRERGRWGSFGVYYEYGRILFDAAVVCASIAIDGAGGALAACLKGDLASALEVLKDMEVPRGVKCRRVVGVGTPSNAAENVSEPVAIVEMLKRRAEVNKTAGTKRKRQDSETDPIKAGFRIPYVGVPVSAFLQNPTPLVPPEFTSDISPAPPPDQSRSASKVKVEDGSDDPISDTKKQKKKPVKNGRESPTDKRKLLAKPKDKEKEKESKYPSWGIRIRPGLPPPYIRDRGQAPQTYRTPKLTLAPTGDSNGQPNTPLVETPSTLHPTSSAPSPLLMSQHLEPQLYDGPLPPTPVHERPMADDARRRSLTAPFDADPEARMQSQGRYSGAAYPQTPAFFDHPSYPTSQVTSPTSTEPAPFSSSALVQPGPGQFPGTSQPQQDYFPRVFREPSMGPNGFDSMPYGGVGPSAPSYPMNSMERGHPSAITDATYMVPDEKVPLGVFVSSEPQMLPGSSQASPRDLHAARRQDWHPPTQNPVDHQYWF